mgnify:CR=1 FL=1
MYLGKIFLQIHSIKLWSVYDVQRSRCLEISLGSYLWQASKHYPIKADSSLKMSNVFPESVRNQLCPKIVWSGEVKTSKLTYFFEVH